MKEIGHCPRCTGKDIIVMKTIGGRREVCKNCGFTDIYSGLTSNTSVMMLVLGLLLLALFSVFIVLNRTTAFQRLGSRTAHGRT